MRRELLMPKLGLTMTEGALLEWMVQPGESFSEGQIIFVIESEKAASEVAAEADGVLTDTVAGVGETLPCGAVIGYWDDGTGDVASPEAAGADAHSGSVESSQPQSDMQPRVPVTPYARRLAQQHRVDLGEVDGSGPAGRVRAKDVLARVSAATAGASVGASAIQAAAPVATTETGVAPAGRKSRPDKLRPPTSRELSAANRLATIKQQVPHFYLALEAEMSAVLALRADFNALQPHDRLTINHFVLAAVAHALSAMPEINRVWTDDGIRTFGSPDVGMAVNTGKGLYVPILRNISGRPLQEVAREAGELIARAQQGRLSAEQMHGGAITVSNAGMHDVTYMTSIINPGQSMILGVGAIREVFRPDAAGNPVIRREMGLVLSADHRVLDGVAALAFLKLVVQALSQPLGLLMGTGVAPGTVAAGNAAP